MSEIPQSNGCKLTQLARKPTIWTIGDTYIDHFMVDVPATYVRHKPECSSLGCLVFLVLKQHSYFNNIHMAFSLDSCDHILSNPKKTMFFPMFQPVWQLTILKFVGSPACCNQRGFIQISLWIDDEATNPHGEERNGKNGPNKHDATLWHSNENSYPFVKSHARISPFAMFLLEGCTMLYRNLGFLSACRNVSHCWHSIIWNYGDSHHNCLLQTRANKNLVEKIV